MTSSQKLLISLIVSSALTASTMRATTPLLEIADSIASSNPALAASQLRNNAERLRLAESLNLSDPEIEVAPQFGAPGKKVGAQITQSFDWPGLYSARRQAADADSHSLDLLQKSQTIETRTEILTTLVDIIAQKQRIELFRQTIKHIDTLMTTASAAASSHDLSLLDLNKLRIENSLAQRRLSQAQRDLAASTATLQTLAGDRPIEPILKSLNDFQTTPLAPAAHYLQAATSASNPAIAYADSRTNSARLQQRVASRSNLPSFTVGYNYEYDLGDHYNGFTLGLSLPIFSTRHKAAAAQAELLTVEAERDQLESTTRAEILSLHEQIAQLDSDIELLNKALTAGDNLRLLDRARQARQITLLEYLADYNYFIDAHEQLIALRAEREQLMAKLSQWL